MDHVKKSKISNLIRKLLQKYEDEKTYYSTDSDCDYTVVTKIQRIPRIKVEREEVSFDYISNFNSDLVEIKTQNLVSAESINYKEAKQESLELNDELPLKIEVNEKNDKKPVKCQICKRRIKVKALDTHLDKCLRKNVNLKPNYNGIFMCAICDNTMKYRRSLLKHYKLYHSPNATRVIKVKNNSEYLQFECYMCEKRMKHKRSLLKHYRLFHYVENKNETENNSFDNAITDIHKCTACPKSYSHLQSLYRHMRKAHRIFRRSIPKKPKEDSLCNFCGKNFNCLWNLNCHIKLRHTDVKPYICDFCSMQFRYKEQLKDHLLNHVNSKPYVCTFEGCTSTFTKYSAWNRHNVRHTQFERKIVERKFPCPFCGKKFQSKTKVR